MQTFGDHDFVGLGSAQATGPLFALQSLIPMIELPCKPFATLRPVGGGTHLRGRLGAFRLLVC